MPAGRKISEHIDEFNKIVFDLANIEVKFEDEDLALLLLTYLPASYEHFVDTLLYGREALTLENVMATLNSKKIKEMSKAKEDDGEGLYVRGRTDRRDSRQSKGKSRSKSRGGRLKCYILQSEDHLKRNCLKNNHKKSTGYVKKDKQPSSSGSTYNDFKLGDNMECKIRGIGKVMIQLKDGSSFMLHYVRCIPELKRNLISLGTLEKEGYTVKLQSNKVKVINGSRVILSRIRRDNYVYSLDGHAMTGEINASVVEKDSLAWVWHKRLRHISEAGLHVLEKQGLFGKKSLGKLDFCENYVLGKSHLVSFGVGRHTIQGVIDHVHSDLHGPSQVKSLGGKMHFLSIVDDYSRRLVENQTGRTVMKLRTDNGLEFCNREFEQLYIKSGIARHLIVVGTPQQNGVAERMNITLMDKVRCLLIQSRLPKTFWAEATCTATYLINRSPSRVIKKKTPMEMWSGHSSDYGMLRIFGCVAYPHDKQGKLEPKAVKCVLLGFLDGVKGYRLYRLDDESPKIVTSRNVVFNKSVMYKDTLKDSGAGEKSVKALHVELELQRLNNHTLEEDQTDKEDGDDEDKAATKEEVDSLRKNKTWELVDHPAGQKLVSCKWMFKIKEGIEGVQKPRYKVRLMACRFTQRAGINYNEVFSLVVRHTSIRVILALTACKDYELEQLDVKTTFLNENLEEVIYMRQPPTYKQGNKAEIGSTKSLLKKEFELKELGEAKEIVSLEIIRDRSHAIGWHFKLSLKDFPVRDCDVERMSKVPYANAVRILMYLMVCTRQDISYAVSVVSRYLANPGKNHWKVVKWILKYLWGTANVGLVYGTNRGNHVDVTGFVDSDYAKVSNKEAEYMAPTEAVNEDIWLRRLLEELGVELNTVAVNCDNQGAIHLSRNHVFHERTKHINVRYHFIRKVLEEKTVKVLNVGT
uniref:Retrotransposon protein, putative, Ty1-copia subclass n=1 Tax=Tanacetum cinerariifolium TaxID=118510 RepID=A0A6L2JHS6_TANCI|nr:retrotransposon protein, putative, Ty1-copia subclass [Tanacetum cinerariifolium]